MSIRISRVYTRTGDAGQTRLAHGEAISKASLRVQAYGDTDELGSHLGYLCQLIGSSTPEQSDIAEKLVRIQQELFDLGAFLAVSEAECKGDVDARTVARLEEELDAWNSGLPVLDSFILAGGGPAGAYCHVCRTVCRRAERSVVALMSHEKVPAGVLVYLNRLSDYLFVLCRVLGQASGEGEVLWARGRTGFA